MHKGGQFTLNCEYDMDTFMLVDMATIQYESIKRIPILPDQAALLETDLMRRSIFGTAAIEGNPLSEEQVGAILQGGRMIGTEQAQREIHNLKEAYAVFNEKFEADAPFLVSEELIKAIHRTLTDGIDYFHNSPGNYRNEIVKVGDANHGGVYTPPKTLDDVKILMALFVEWINSKEMLEANVFIRAAAAHYHLAKIHPFQDGNGRTARLLEAIILAKGGIRTVPPMLSNFYYRHVDDYFVAFSEARKQKSFAPFLKFFATGLTASLKELENIVIGMATEQLIKNYIADCFEKKKISQRLYDLLVVLQQTGQSFTLSTLYTNPVLKALYVTVSESTARRDIKKLQEMKFVVEREGAYWLNDGVLGN